MRQSTRFKRTQRPSISAVAGGANMNAGNPAISSLSSGVPLSTSATITWTTNIVSDSQVFWGLTTAYGGASSPIMNFTYTTSHSVEITGLTANTTYNYKVLTRTPGGTYTFSANNTFITAL